MSIAAQVEQPQLEHMRGVEARDPQGRTGSGERSAGRHQAHELRADDLRAPRFCLLLDPGHDLVQRRRLEVLDVHRDLDEPGAGQVEPERAHAGESSARLADERSDLARRRELAAQIDVERDQRPPRPDDHSAGSRVKLTRAIVRLELARRDPSSELRRPPAPEERRPPTGRELSVEEDREPELVADTTRERRRRLPRFRQPVGPERDERDDVGGADPRVCAFVAPQIDPLAGALDAFEERRDELVRLTHEREHGPVVIRIHVHVEEARRTRERRLEGRDRLGVTPLREVRHRFQKHASYSRSVKAYYEARAPEYDDWWLGTGRFAERERPGWEEEREALVEAISTLPPVRTLDVACGTGFLTRHLPGAVTGLDASASMLAIAAKRVPTAAFVESDALRLPFADGSFDRLFTSHFYGHLDETERGRFLAEARRLAPELVIVDSALRDDVEPEELQERVLNDGTRWQVLKRFFTPETLAGELDSGETLFAGRWFVAVRAR